MSRYDENEFLTDSPEEIREREQQEAIRRTIREEIRRTRLSDDDAEEYADDATEDTDEEQESRTPQWIVALGALFSGEILIGKRIKGGYNYLLCIAILYLVGIIIIFSSLHLEIRRNRLAKEVGLLREKSWRMTEERNARTSHSAIVEEIEKRGLGLSDPAAPITIVEEGEER